MWIKNLKMNLNMNINIKINININKNINLNLNIDINIKIKKYKNKYKYICEEYKKNTNTKMNIYEGMILSTDRSNSFFKNSHGPFGITKSVTTFNQYGQTEFIYLWCDNLQCIREEGKGEVSGRLDKEEWGDESKDEWGDENEEEWGDEIKEEWGQMRRWE